jgi:hypothetical protein
MPVFDHQRLVERYPVEVERFRAFVSGLPRGEVTPTTVVHEPDDSCCAREPWPVTLTTVLVGIAPRGRIVWEGL